MSPLNPKREERAATSELSTISRERLPYTTAVRMGFLKIHRCDCLRGRGDMCQMNPAEGEPLLPIGELDDATPVHQHNNTGGFAELMITFSGQFAASRR